MIWLKVTFAMIAKLAITSSYGTIYVFTAEQFPTVIRNVGLGASSTFARVGGVIAPYINYLVRIIEEFFLSYISNPTRLDVLFTDLFSSSIRDFIGPHCHSLSLASVRCWEARCRYCCPKLSTRSCRRLYRTAKLLEC